MLDKIVELVKEAKTYTNDVEFSALDATRADVDFLVKAVKTAEENGIVSIDCTQLETFVDRANKWRKMYEDYNRKEPIYTRL